MKKGSVRFAKRETSCEVLRRRREKRYCTPYRKTHSVVVGSVMPEMPFQGRKFEMELERREKILYNTPDIGTQIHISIYNGVVMPEMPFQGRKFEMESVRDKSSSSFLVDLRSRTLFFTTSLQNQNEILPNQVILMTWQPHTNINVG